VLESSPADETTGKGEEAFVDLVTAIGAQEELAAVVQPSEGAFDDPAVAAEPGAVFVSRRAINGSDPSLPDEASAVSPFHA
jgi:hypothetical protein